MNTYLTIQELMKTLKVSRTTVYTLIKCGKLKSTHVGRLVRVRADDLRAFMGEEKMNVQTRNRDSQGRFFQSGRQDARQKVMEQLNAEEDKLASVYVKICDQIGQPKITEFLDIKQWPETGHWHIGHRANSFFLGVLMGVAFMKGKGRGRTVAKSVLNLMREADEIQQHIGRLEHRYHGVVEQRG